MWPPRATASAWWTRSCSCILLASVASWPYAYEAWLSASREGTPCDVAMSASSSAPPVSMKEAMWLSASSRRLSLLKASAIKDAWRRAWCSARSSLACRSRPGARSTSSIPFAHALALSATWARRDSITRTSAAEVDMRTCIISVCVAPSAECATATTRSAARRDTILPLPSFFLSSSAFFKGFATSIFCEA